MVFGGKGTPICIGKKQGTGSPPSPYTPAVAIPGQKFKEEFKAEYGSMHVSWTIEGFDTSKIVYEVSKILGFLETPYGIPRVSRDYPGFWGIPSDSRGF